jgi:hypothetical protein
MLNNSMFSKLTFIGGAFLLTTLIFAPIKGYADTAQSWFLVPGDPYSSIYYNNWASVGKNTVPKHPLDVMGRIGVSNPLNNGDQYIYASFDSAVANNTKGNIGVYKNAGTNQGYGKLTINNGATGTVANDQTGFVGVRLFDPAYPLDVNGTINTNSNIQASGNIQATGSVTGGSVSATGNITSNGVLTANDNGKPAGGVVINTGDDAQITDLDQANSLGIQGSSNTTQVRIKLGSNGGWLTSNNGEVCLGAC